MIERMAELVNDDAWLVKRGRLFNDTFAIGVDGVDYLIRVANGRIESVEKGPHVMRSWTFAIRADAKTWETFWQSVPPPGFHDIFALLRKGLIALDGDLQPMMAHLLYIKLMLAKPREIAAATTT
jgi:hypothetical protein